jgi:hypothetical protein
MSSSQPEYGVDESRLIRGAHGTIAEPDDLAVGASIKVGVVTLLVFAVFSLWMWRIMVAEEKQLLPDGAAPTPALVRERAYEIGIVNQWTFEEDSRAYQLTAERQRYLESEGWVDRRQNLVHLPIADAMKQVVQQAGQQQPGQPAPQSPTPPQAPPQQQP